jgi:hypothetical protein
MGERVSNTPAEIIDLTGELTLENVHQCYRKTRDRMMQNGGAQVELEIEELDWAYRALLTEIEQSSVNDSEDCVVSALLLPQLNAESISRLDEDGNVLYLKRNNSDSRAMPSAPMSALDLPELKGAFNPQKTSAQTVPAHKVSPRDYRTHQELDAVTPVRSGEPSAYQPPRRLKTLVGEGDKDVVDVCARAAMSPDSVNMMNNIIDSAEQITGSLLKKLREEMGVGVEEMSVRTKIPRKYLLAIETDRYEQLPAAVYFRGFLVSYLRYLNLKREDIIDAITENYRSRLRIQSRTRRS